MTALEEEAVKVPAGESQPDLSIVNQMLLKHRVKLEASQTAMEEAQPRMQAEQENAKATKAQVDVRTGYKAHIKFKISLKQFLGQE